MPRTTSRGPRPPKKPDGPSRPETIIEAPLKEALSSRYLAYALSTITSRALPDVRDGLKPVHRRILFAMREMRLSPSGGFKKCAKVVGEVMGNYHPHGDQAIYDALARLVQDFSTRIPLVDGQGNFGNIDGDNPAAMRYTESRLTMAAELLLEGIDEETVDFRPTYDGEDTEPVVLPAGFPNLMANGANGIAVGMATSIPPHNVAELIDASLHLIKHPNASVETLLKHVKGPDFPTGGVCVESPEALAEAYATGRGGFRLRALWETEDLGRGRYQIVVTEIPYQVQKSKLVERIADLVRAKKLPAIVDVRDESAEDVRLVLEPKSGALDAAMVMESVFRATDLENRFPLNLNLLDANGAPRVMGLRGVLQSWLDHRKNVLVRRSEFRRKTIEHRLEILAGLLVAYLNLDEVIRIIREEDDPKAELMATFELSDMQAEAILNMRLRSLRKLEEMEIRREDKDLKQELRDLKALLKSDDAQWATISDELRAVRKVFDPKSGLGRRRTVFGDAPSDEEIALDALIEKEPVTVVISEKGWVRTMKGHVEDPAEIKYRDGDGEKFVTPCETTDRLLAFGTNGRFYALTVADLPGGRGAGEPVRLIVDLEDEADLAALFVLKGGRRFLVASTAGKGFLVDEDECVAQNRRGKQVLNVDAGAEAAVCRIAAEGDQWVAVIGENKKLLVFDLADLPVMARGKGVQLQKYAKGGLLDAKTFADDPGLTWTDRAGRVQSADDWREWIGKRAGAGKAPPKGFPRSGRFG